MSSEDIRISALVNDQERLNQGYSVGTALEITYSFKQNDPSVDAIGVYQFTQVYGFQAMNDEQKNAVRTVLSAFDSVSGLEFREVESGGVLQYGLYSGRDGIPEGIPNDGESMVRDFDAPGQDVWINHTEAENLQVAPGQMGYFLLMHETGHALGLKHPGNYNGFENGPFLPSGDDHSSNTVMSYNGGITGNLGQYDTMALQYLYSVDGAPITETIQTSNSTVDNGGVLDNGSGGQNDRREVDATALLEEGVIYLTGEGDNDRFSIDTAGGRDLSGTTYVEGGEGLDTVVVDLNSSQIREFFEDSETQLLSFDGDFGNLFVDFTDTERFQLNDTMLAFDDEGSAGQAYRLYKAAFDRTPDTSGLGYWIDSMDQGTQLNDVASGFINSQEFQKLYGSGVSDADYVGALYRNVLDREPDGDGYQWWLDQLSSGANTREGVLTGFSESAENKQNVEGLIQNGISYDLWTG